MYASLIAGKIIFKISKAFNLGSGSTWPGHFALKSDKNIIKKILKKNSQLKVILIAGTNGKTTTTKALSHILKSQGVSVLTNSSGANLLNGLASILVLKASLLGNLKEEALLFEVDENSLSKVLKQIPHPDGIILLDLFRDQLDRYGEVNKVFDNWKREISKLDEKTLVVANADDPKIAFIASNLKNKAFFSISNKFKTEKELAHSVDSTNCPKCQHTLSFSKISYSHLGNYKCPNCNFKNPESEVFDIKTKLSGNYNLYNLSAAILTTERIFKIKQGEIIESLKNFEPAFGRQEKINIDGKNVLILLSKNPTGFNESLKVAVEGNFDNKTSALLLLLNDRIPDGRDISWIWDVDFEMLKNKNLDIFVSGDRAYDLSNRLNFADVKNTVFEAFEKAYNFALKQTPNDKTLVILPTYSAMLEIRREIFGKSIL
jgi:UDP-N-acetylmuramyl tripeptide synthase